MAGYKGPGPIFNQAPIDLFIGDSSTLSFPLSYNPGTVNGLIVVVGGAVQRPGTDFTCTGTTLLFVEAPPAPTVSGTQNILVIYRGVAGAMNVPADASITWAKIDPAAKALLAQLDQINVFTKAQRGTPVVLPTLTGTLNIDWSAGNNFYGQVTGNLTFSNGYTNWGAGQCGVIRVQQNGATLYNWAFGTNWKYVGGSSAIPSQTQTLGAYDEIVYYIHSATEVSFAVRGNVS